MSESTHLAALRTTNKHLKSELEKERQLRRRLQSRLDTVVLAHFDLDPGDRALLEELLVDLGVVKRAMEPISGASDGPRSAETPVYHESTKWARGVWATAIQGIATVVAGLQSSLGTPRDERLPVNTDGTCAVCGRTPPRRVRTWKPDDSPCRCRSYHERTGEHTEACPLSSTPVEP